MAETPLDMVAHSPLALPGREWGNHFMTFIQRLSGLSILAVLAACAPATNSEQGGSDEAAAMLTEQPSAETTTTPPAKPDHAHISWAGTWIGVEGLFVKITPTTPGRYDLEMVPDLDALAKPVIVEGRDGDGGIAFARDGKTLLLRRATGDETGLKYLAGKRDCVMVGEGEGFCRD